MHEPWSLKGGEDVKNGALKTMRGLPPDLEREQALGVAPIDYLMLNLRGGCNYRCLKCFSDNPPRNKELSLGEMSRIVAEASGLGVRAVVIAGEGEPVSAPDFRHVVRHVREAGMITIVFTNAGFLDTKMATFLRDNDCSVIVSCDSLRKAVYERLVGVRGVFMKAMRHMEKCRELFAETIETDGDLRIVRMAINTTVCRQNVDELPRIREFCGDDILFFCNCIARSGAAEQYWNELCGTDEELLELENVSRRESETGGCSSMTVDSCCGYLRHGIGIGSDGSLLPCAYTQTLAGAFGNIVDFSLEEAVAEVKTRLASFYGQHGREACIVRHQHYADLGRA